MHIIIQVFQRTFVSPDTPDGQTNKESMYDRQTYDAEVIPMCQTVNADDTMQTC